MTDSKVVMITGGASGIGAATAEMAASQGHRVIIADIDAARGADVAARIGQGATSLRLDICAEAEWAAVLDHVWTSHGRLDVLINNAAIVHTGWARDLPLSAHLATVQTNFMGAVTGMMNALPRMKAQGFGHLITVSSMVAFLPFPGLASYAAAKHALRAFHAALAIEERASPLDFTLIYPTATETPMLEQEARDDALALAFSGTPITPADVAIRIVEAITTRPAEIFVPPERGAAVQKLGLDPVALRAYVEANEAVGQEKQQLRRSRQPG